VLQVQRVPLRRQRAPRRQPSLLVEVVMGLEEHVEAETGRKEYAESGGPGIVVRLEAREEDKARIYLVQDDTR